MVFDLITQLRKYRFSFTNGINDKGMALFDLIGTFALACIIDFIFQIPQKYRHIYYLSLIPFGIVIHLLVKQPTFLNTNLLSMDLNIDSIAIKVIVLLILYMIYPGI
jgi:hypothetical protein